MKLWVHIILSFMAVISIASASVIYVVNSQIKNSFHLGQDRWSEVLSHAVAKSVLEDTIKKDKQSVKKTLKRIMKNSKMLEYILVVDFNGDPFASSFDKELKYNLKKMEHWDCLKSEYNIGNTHMHRVNASNDENPYPVTDHVYPLIENLNSHLHIGIKGEFMHQVISETQNKILLVTGIILAIACFLAVYLGRRVTQPIEDLTENIRGYRKGKKWEPVKSSDFVLEAKQLISDFDLMIKERDDFEKEILDYHDKLEAKVEERTRKLAQEVEMHKETEKKLLESKQVAETANKAKSEFLSRMSHELRTPLNAVMGFSQLIEMGLDEKDSVNRDYIAEVLSASRHLLLLINEVLDLAKIESGNIEISLEPVEWKGVVEESIKMVKKVADNNNITLVYDDSKCLCCSASIMADYLKLKQVIINLLSNAIKYNKPNGKVTVKLETRDKNTCRLMVTDTGHGIPVKLQKRVFVPFERLGAHNSAVDGVGIGLVITRALVEKMNGKIDFESKPGEGSSFWIDMPIKTSQDDASLPEELNLSEEHCIFYVDDNLKNIELIRQFFSGYSNLELVVAETPSQAFDILESVRPDLILLDINLPEMSGFEVMRRLSCDDRVNDIPVIALSANAMQHDIEEAKEFGFADYISKPVDISHLSMIIARYLD